MRQIVRLTGLAAIVAVQACSSTSESVLQTPTMFRGDAAHTGVVQTRGIETAASTLWTFKTGAAVRSSPVVADDRILVGSSDGRLYALDRQTGDSIWSVDAGAPVNSTPAATGNTVVFGSRDGTFHGVSLRTGAVRWRFETGELIPWSWGFEGWDYYTSSPVIQDSVVVFGAGDGVTYALNVETGAELWRFATKGRIRSSPAIAGGVVFIGSTDGHAYAVHLANGQEKWRYATRGAELVSADLGVDRRSIIASPAVDAAHVYIGSRDGFMYALDRETGEMRWRVSHSGSWAMSSPALTGDRMFSGTSDGRWVHAVDVASGEELWRFIGRGYTWSSPALVGNTLYIGDAAGYLHAIDKDTGEQRWSYRARGGVITSPSVSDGVVFFGSDDGKVYALHEDATVPTRVVFWDEAYERFSFLQQHLAVRTYLEGWGYVRQNADSLAAFMTARIDDRAPSVVVFAIDHVPAEIGATPSDTTLFRRYLDAGGKVVWLGLPPMLLERNPETAQVTAFDRTRPSSLLGVDHSSVNFDSYNSNPTALGRTWGMAVGRITTYAVDTADGIDVLATDENGRAGIWVRNYGGPPGTGFVSMGRELLFSGDLELIRTLAEY
jgi:outer membrane protein assembly factor BamB